MVPFRFNGKAVAFYPNVISLNQKQYKYKFSMITSHLPRLHPDEKVEGFKRYTLRMHDVKQFKKDILNKRQ